MGYRVRIPQTVHYWENFTKQKMKSIPNFVMAGQVRSGPAPLPGVQKPFQVQGEGQLPWFLGRLSRMCYPLGNKATVMFWNRTVTPKAG